MWTANKNPLRLSSILSSCPDKIGIRISSQSNRKLNPQSSILTPRKSGGFT
ncbi:MAG: hypothetical protein ACD_3C00038G0001, partial [uncultured bacterium (gcode 4)]